MLANHFIKILFIAGLFACGGEQLTKENPVSTATTESDTAAKTQSTLSETNPPPAQYSKDVAYPGSNIKFSVSGQGNKFTITPSGLTASNEPISMDFQGSISDVFTDDIDGDNSPEVAVVTENGPEKKRTAYIFTTFNRKSFGMVNYPELTDVTLLKGYQGEDDYTFMENTFVRRFPISENGQKTGKTRQFQYKLKPGEAMKQLVLDKHVEY
jgi:hypothetical protein